MNGLPRHPGTEELAEFRAGVTDGARGDQLAAHLAECPECSSLSERLGHLPTVLASIPRPAIPIDIETRIMAAITAEAGARGTPDGKDRHLIGRSTASVSPGGRPPGPSDRAEPRWHRPYGQSLTATVGILVAAAACLVLAFIGFRLSGQGHPATAAPSRGGPVRTRGSTSAGGMIVPRQNATSPALRQPAGTSFPVLVSTTNFRSSTLQAQVTQQLTATSHARAGNQSRPGLRIPPSKSLAGCVARLDGDTQPTLVEEASYQSRPAYVIAIPAHAWVVARDCTPTRLAVLASVALPPAR